MKTETSSLKISIILLLLIGTAISFFYLGIKFGGKVVSSLDGIAQSDQLLPNEKLIKEMERLIKEKNHNFVSHDILTNQKEEKIVLENETNDQTFDHKSVLVEYQKQFANADFITNPTKELPQQEDIASVPDKNDIKEIKETKEIKKVETTQKTPDVKITRKEQLEKAKLAKAEQLKKDTEKKKLLEKQQKEKLAKEKLAKEKSEKEKLAKAKLEQDKLAQKKLALAKEAEKTKSTGKFQLQVGSYSSPDQANTEMNYWKQRGYPATLVSSYVKGKGQWYRLKLGQFSSLDDVRKEQQNIMRKYNRTAMIITSQ